MTNDGFFSLIFTGTLKMLTLTQTDEKRPNPYFLAHEMLLLLVNKNEYQARHQWLTPVILATQEAEIRRITVGSQPGQIVQETLS
jgi:hypothetical protein